MAFKIDKKTAELMYQHQNGFIPKGIGGATQIEQYMGMVNADPNKWASTYKHVTGKDMTTSKPTANVDAKLIAKYMTDKFLNVTKSAISDQVAMCKKNPAMYKKILDSIDDKFIKFKVSSSLVEEWFTTVYTTEKNPSANDILYWVNQFKKNPIAYKTMLQAIAVNIPSDVENWAKFNKVDPDPGIGELVATAGVKAGVKAKVVPGKPLTLSQKIIAVPVKQPTEGEPLIDNDPEIVELTEVAKELIKKENKNKGWGTEYDNATTALRKGVDKTNNAVTYLTAVIKQLNPTWKRWDPTQKVKPGGMHGLPVPTGKLSTTAQSLAASPEAETKAVELSAKIKEYEAEIARLKKLQKAADAAKAKAAKEKEKLAGIDPKLLQYFTYIEQHCSQFLKSAQEADKFLYRGQRDTKLPVFVGRPRADREPKDSSVEAQKLADKCLTIMGFKALRSNSIFTSADYNQAEGYGTVYAIFPKNGFDFTWSPKHDDLVIHSTNELTGAKGGKDEEDLYYEWNYVLEDYTFISENTSVSDVNMWITDISKMSDTKSLALAKVVAKMPEYIELRKAMTLWLKIDEETPEGKMVKVFADTTAKFLAFDDLKVVKGVVSSYNRKKLEKFLLAANSKLETSANPKIGDKDKALAEKVIKHMGFTKENMAAALKSEHEICILGEYVAVNADKYRKELRRYFLETMPATAKTT